MNNKEFMFLTVKEYLILCELYEKDKLEDIKAIYELIRMQTYFLLTPHTKRGFSWLKFIKEMMPFKWDKEHSNDLLEMNEDEWEEFESTFNKEVKETKEISLEEMDKIKI